MRTIVDILMIGIILYSGWRGFKNGIIIGVCGLAALVLSIFGANLVADTYSNEFTGMLQPFANGLTDSAVTSVLSDTVNPEDPVVVVLTEDEKESVYSVSFAALRQLGLAEGSSDLIAAEMAEEVEDVNQAMVNTLAVKLSTRMVHAITFTLSFILIIIVFSVIGSILGLTFALPGIEVVNYSVGAVFGVARGILLCLVIGVVFRYAGFVFLGGFLDETSVLKYFINAKLLSGMLGM